MRPSFMVGNISIDKNVVPLVIPDIGINHEGSLSVAKKMVMSAHKAGARIIKHQTHVIDDEMSKEARHTVPGNASVSIYEIMKRCALPEEEELELMCFTKSLGMVFLSTPFSRAAADRLERFGVSAYKIGSGEMNNYPLVEHIASFGKPIILSTGMNNLTNVAKAVNILEKYGVDYALLHTTNLYPTSACLVRLGAMTELAAAFPGVPFGLSDHTINNNACIAAIAQGASIVERHFVDTKKRNGPDVVCSMDETDLHELLCATNEVHQMLGGHKESAYEERVTENFAFATVVSIKDIKRGELLTKENIWVKRPGTGDIPAEEYNALIGRRVVVDIPLDTHLKHEMMDTI